MKDASKALANIPTGLRKPLIEEYSNIIHSYLERRWSPAELSGGRFCEVVFTILDGYAKGKYASKPSKPRDFVKACRTLEKNTNVPRSFRILIPRLLPALYEIRNNRGVGHVGGDVDPNYMDASTIVSNCSWILAELVRVFHGQTIDEAQAVVDSLAERRIPLIWQNDDMKRVLDPSLPLRDQLLLLIASTSSGVSTDNLYLWSGYNNKGYFTRILRTLHRSRMIELSNDELEVQMLPPGDIYIANLIGDLSGDNQ